MYNQSSRPPPPPPPPPLSLPPQFNICNPNLIQYNPINTNFIPNFPPIGGSVPQQLSRPILETPKSIEYFNYNQQFQLDQNWVNNWTAQKTQIEKPASKKTKNSDELKINDAQQALRFCCTILKQLKTAENELKLNLESYTNLAWEQKLMEIDKQKALLLNSLSPFDNSAIISKLKKRVNKRKHRRRADKVKKTERHIGVTQLINRRQHLHNSINEWLTEQKEQVAEIKRQESEKREADCILSEVTKKKADARRQLSLLSALIKLRGVRQQALEARGEKISMEDSNTFSTITERLKNMWQKALDKYCIEEQGLKETLKKKSDNVCIKDEKYESISKEWNLTLFGPDIVPSNAYWVLTCAERDLETFIALRKSWDTFLTVNNQQGTNLPIGWILPQNPSPSWARYLQNTD